VTVPDPSATPPAKASRLLKRILLFVWIFFGVVVVLGALGGVLAANKKDQNVADGPAPEPATPATSAATSAQLPVGGMPLAASMQTIMAKSKEFVGGGEWEEFVEDGFKLLVPGRSRDFKAARVSGIHEVSVRKLGGRESGRFATSIVVYLDNNLRDANGRHQEYRLIADWISQVESWSKNAPASEAVKAAALHFLEAKLPSAFAATGIADVDNLTVPNGLSFSFLTGGKASIGQTVKWLSVETTLRLGIDPAASPTSTSAKPALRSTKEQVAAQAQAEVDQRAGYVDQLVTKLRSAMDAAGEGIETQGDVFQIARMIQQGDEKVAFYLLEKSTNFRTARYRKPLIEIRDAYRLVAVAQKELAALQRQALLERLEQAEAQRAAQATAVGVQVPAVEPAPTAPVAPVVPTSTP